MIKLWQLLFNIYVRANAEGLNSFLGITFELLAPVPSKTYSLQNRFSEPEIFWERLSTWECTKGTDFKPDVIWRPTGMWEAHWLRTSFAVLDYKCSKFQPIFKTLIILLRTRISIVQTEWIRFILLKNTCVVFRRPCTCKLHCRALCWYATTC